MTIPKPVTPPIRTLLGPGPSDIHPRVLAALARPTVGHMDPYYLQIMDELQSMLREVFRTKNRLTMAISGTGSAGQEATVLNLVEPGERVLICVNGVFGGRLADMAERAGGEVSKVEKPWGEVFTVAEVKEALARVKPKVVAIVMAETSTGAWQPIEEIAAAVRDAGAMLIVDTVTALGGIPVEIDRWQIDAVYSGTQKCLGCPPGLAPVSFSDRAVQKILNRREKGAKLVSRCVADCQLLGRRSRVSSHGADQHDVRAARGVAVGARRGPGELFRPAPQESASAAGRPRGGRHRVCDATGTRFATIERGADSRGHR